MNRQSLRLRLLLGATAAIFLALAVSWLALTLLFERHIERRVEEDLTRNAQQLVANLTLDTSGKPTVDAAPTDVRFVQPGSGLYWQLSASSASLRSASLWDQGLPVTSTVASDEWQTRVANGPFKQRLILIERTVRPLQAGTSVLVQVAQDRTSISEARNEFARELAQYLLVLWIVLSIAAWLQVHLGLSPLRKLRDELAVLHSNPTARLTSDHPSEVQPLTQAINALADAYQHDLDAARRRAADLAHGLKTPLAALSAQSRRARTDGAVSAADGLDRAIAAARNAVEAELARSRVALIRRARPGAQAPASVVAEQVIGVVERTDFGADRVFEIDIPEELMVPMSPEDLAELMGAVIENAARHSRRRVRVQGRQVEQTRSVCVEDDGPGLDATLVQEALTRGTRLDEHSDGHGLGLAIARELVEATGGTLLIDSGDLGGLRVTARWPK